MIDYYKLEIIRREKRGSHQQLPAEKVATAGYRRLEVGEIDDAVKSLKPLSYSGVSLSAGYAISSVVSKYGNMVSTQSKAGIPSAGLEGLLKNEDGQQPIGKSTAAAYGILPTSKADYGIGGNSSAFTHQYAASGFSAGPDYHVSLTRIPGQDQFRNDLLDVLPATAFDPLRGFTSPTMIAMDINRGERGSYSSLQRVPNETGYSQKSAVAASYLTRK